MQLKRAMEEGAKEKGRERGRVRKSKNQKKGKRDGRPYAQLSGLLVLFFIATELMTSDGDTCGARVRFIQHRATRSSAHNSYTQMQESKRTVLEQL